MSKQFQKRPAHFLLYNSKGFPDFVMTMLTVVVVVLILTVLFWMAINLFALTDLASRESEIYVSYLANVNDNARLIVLGLCSSVFTLAGTYYLRRTSFDKHFAERERTELEFGVSTKMEALAHQNSFVDRLSSTTHHPNYDDEEEDI